jgi:hypothetical protein
MKGYTFRTFRARKSSNPEKEKVQILDTWSIKAKKLQDLHNLTSK